MIVTIDQLPIMLTPDDFHRLAEPSLAPAYRLAYALLRSKSDAEDAVQDSYIRAFRAVGQLRDEFRPWFMAIVRNVCYRQLQQRQRTNSLISLEDAIVRHQGEDDQDWQPTSGERNPEEALIAASNRMVVRRLLDCMPPAFREVLFLREIEDRSYQEIAEIIGKPRGTVMSRLARARRELLKRYRREQARDPRDAL